MPYFICPNCKQRSIDHDGLQEIDNVPVACERCGFGFLFELMDDYYPGPNTGFIVCDREGRIIASGRGVFELAGYREQELLGADVVERLGLNGWNGDQSPAAIALEWGVRRLGGEQDLPHGAPAGASRRWRRTRRAARGRGKRARCSRSGGAAAT